MEQLDTGGANYNGKNGGGTGIAVVIRYKYQ